jgi:uncharacterized SAM-binding protein YcdF (DUF218 family)/transcriptional regulator with XRE-family HTH domain
VASVTRWTGHEAKALRRALRLSVRAFAEDLGVAVRTVTKWESFGTATTPRPVMQAALDTALARAGADAKLRFELLLLEDGNTPLALRYRSGPREWDYETWTDDLGRAAACLARQDFKFAASLIDRWLRRFDPHGLDQHGLYLHARSLVLLGDLQRDQGAIQGPLSARQTYRKALHLFHSLDVARRAAQVELSLAVVDEMSGQLGQAAVGYEALVDDERLSPRDRTRARLWIGTALSKESKNDYAIQVMTTATREFEDLEEPDDWSVAHQKLALAYRGAGDLGSALRYIDVALANRSTDSPMQRVRLDTAHAHILLSDSMTAENGLVILGQAARVSSEYGLSHQLRSIEGIRHAFERQAPLPPRSIHAVTSPHRRITEQNWQDAQLIWDYHQVGHELSPCDAAIGLGSHDLGVAAYAAELYHAGLFPVLVFSGANSPTTTMRFPRGEAVHYREHAIELGVPNNAILVEPQASNTGQNIALSRVLLAEHGHTPSSLLLISKPYMERRAFATCRKVWPEVEVVCASEPLKFDDYVKSVGDEKLVIDMLVGDLQRVIEYPKLGFAIEQDVPASALAAYNRLLTAGFDSRVSKQ